MYLLRFLVAACAVPVFAAGLMNTLTTEEKREGFILLFNGEDLSGWDGDKRIWTVRDGAIVGSTDTHTIQQNTFLIYSKPYADFILKFDIKLRDGNSGVQFRSSLLPNWVVAGYQADASEADERSAWGNLYDERGKGRGWMRAQDEGWQKAKPVLRRGDWNHYEVRALGRQVTLELNGVRTLDLEVEKTESGVIAIQAHRGPPMEVQIRNMKLKPLR